MGTWKPFKNDKYDIHNYLLRKILICSLRNVVMFTLSLRLWVNITTFLWGTYQYLPFGAGYVYSIFTLRSKLCIFHLYKHILLFQIISPLFLLFLPIHSVSIPLIILSQMFFPLHFLWCQIPTTWHYVNSKFNSNMQQRKNKIWDQSPTKMESE